MPFWRKSAASDLLQANSPQRRGGHRGTSVVKKSARSTKGVGVVKESLLIAGIVIFSVPSVWAQSTGLSGLVEDQRGGVVPEVRITLTNLDTGLARSTVSDELGRYQYAAVLPGEYQITAEREGFRKEVQTGIRVTIDRHAIVNLTLHVGEVTEQIVVAAAPSPVEIHTGEVGGLVDERRVSDLPLNGRDWMQLAELHPGVVRARSTGAGNTSNSFNGRISVSGQRANATNFFLDGTDISVYSQARPPGSVSQGLVLGVEAIREFRIVTSSFSAEYGTKSGGLVDVVTKSGTNDLHGSVFWFHRNDALDARNFFDPGAVPEFRRHQFGASAGGPIRKKKTFFFVNYEGLREAKGDTSGDITPNLDVRRGFLPNPLTGALEFVGVDPAIEPFLELYPLPNGTDFGNGTGLWTGSANRDTDEDYVTLRTDHYLTGKDSIYGRYTVDRSHAFLPFGGNAPFPGFPRFNTGRDHVLTLEETHIFSPALLNTIRAGFNRRVRLTGPSNPNPHGLSFSLVPGASLGQIRVGGIGVMGNSGRSEADLVNNVFQLTDSLTYARGRQNLKFGVDLARIQLNDTLQIDQNGSITLSDVRSFITNRPSLFRGVLPGTDYARGLRFAHAAFYVQDNIRWKPHFTVNLGLRYEPWTNVAEVNGKLPILLDPLQATGPGSFQLGDTLFLRNPSTSNWAPRAGFAWDPFGTGKTSIRGGAGIFFDTPYNGDLIDPVILAPPFVQTVEVRNPSFPNILEGATGRSPQLAAVLLEYGNLHWPYVMQYHLAVQREVIANTVLTVSYNGMRGIHLVSRRELNTRIPEILPDGRKFYPSTAAKRNPGVGSLTLFATDARAWYDGLQVSVNRRFAQGFSVLGSYTFSKALDEAPAAISFTEISGGPKVRMDSDDLARDKGLGAFDARHAAAMSFLWDLPFGNGPSSGGGAAGFARKVIGGWSLSGVAILTSGNPFTPLISFNNSRSGVAGATATTVDRPNLKPGFGNNPVTGNPDQWYDPNAFELPPAGFFGNLGRNTLIGPGFSNVDFSLRKEFGVKRIAEQCRIQLRVEFFNALNHPNFDLPGNAQNATSASFIFTNTSGKPNLAATRPVKTTNDPREIQFALKFVW